MFLRNIPASASQRDNLTIARRFNAGVGVRRSSRPAGTAEIISTNTVLVIVIGIFENEDENEDDEKDGVEDTRWILWFLSCKSR